MNAVLLLIATSAVGVDVGWLPLSDGGVEYIIQIEPELVDTLLKKNDLEIAIPSGLDAADSASRSAPASFLDRRRQRLPLGGQAPARDRPPWECRPARLAERLGRRRGFSRSSAIRRTASSHATPGSTAARRHRPDSWLRARCPGRQARFPERPIPAAPPSGGASRARHESTGRRVGWRIIRQRRRRSGIERSRTEPRFPDAQRLCRSPSGQHLQSARRSRRSRPASRLRHRSAASNGRGNGGASSLGYGRFAAGRSTRRPRNPAAAGIRSRRPRRHV